MIASIGNNNRLLEFIPGDEIRIPDPSIPLNFTIVITTFQNQYLFLHSLERQMWEAPGGSINAGESAHDCARREVLEETGQVIDALAYKGLFKVQIDGVIEYGALFVGEIRELRPFAPNDEADQITIVASFGDLKTPINPLSRLLIQYS